MKSEVSWTVLKNGRYWPGDPTVYFSLGNSLPPYRAIPEYHMDPCLAHFCSAFSELRLSHPTSILLIINVSHKL